MQLIDLKATNKIIYKNNTDDLSFKSDDLTIKKYNKISNFYYEISVSTNTAKNNIIQVLDTDDNIIDEIAIKSVIALPEQQFIFMKGNM